MSRSFQDAKMVLLGMRKVGQTLINVKEAEWKHFWETSSCDAVFGYVKNVNKCTCDITLDSILKDLRIKSEKVSVVCEGMRHFVKYKYNQRIAVKSVLENYDNKNVDTHQNKHFSSPPPFSKTFANGGQASYSTYTRSIHSQASSKDDEFTGNKENDNEPEKQKNSTVEESKPEMMKKPVSDQKTTQQKLSDKSRESKVPSSRVGRLMSYGGLAAGIGMGAIAEVTKRTLGKNEQGSASIFDKSIFLNEANVERVVDTLCKVRGAALKIGQMLSLQDDAMIGPQLQQVLERVRQSADFMPFWQAEKVMTQELGSDWRSKYADFEERPFAAASIGQVHAGTLPDGKRVAVKIQYPGVAEGIESDIRNLMTTLKVWQLLPPGLFIENLVSVARRELILEVDYHYEAECAIKFREILKGFPEYYVPEVISELSTKRVFTSEMVNGLPLDKCNNLDQETINELCSRIMKLTLLELYQFNYMQTDPNWSNFMFDPETRRLSLLDFGATRKYDKSFVDKYLRVIKACYNNDRIGVLKFSQEIGFLSGYESKTMENAHVDAAIIMGEAFAYDGIYDFGNQNITKRVMPMVSVMMEQRLTPPPEAVYSLHRKVAGIFLLCAKLKAQVPCKKLFDEVCAEYKFDT